MNFVVETLSETIALIFFPDGALYTVLDQSPLVLLQSAVVSFASKLRSAINEVLSGLILNLTVLCTLGPCPSNSRSPLITFWGHSASVISSSLIVVTEDDAGGVTTTPSLLFLLAGGVTTTPLLLLFAGGVTTTPLPFDLPEGLTTRLALCTFFNFIFIRFF